MFQDDFFYSLNRSGPKGPSGFRVSGHSATRVNFIGAHSHAIAPAHFCRPNKQMRSICLFGRTKRRKQPERYTKSGKIL
jgi:hypothetical protein